MEVKQSNEKMFAQTIFKTAARLDSIKSDAMKQKEARLDF